MILAEPKPTVVQLDLIRIDGNTQPRAAISEPHVEEYAQLLRDGAALPGVDVFFDGAEYWLADGFHRYHAHKRLPWMVNIAAVIHKGTRRDAVLFSVGANATHGLPRTNADKRKAVMTLLRDAEWAQWSDREIARRCAVQHQLVGNVRREVAASLDESPSETRSARTKHGTVTEMNVSNIGKGRVNGNGKKVYGAEAESLDRRDERRAAALDGAPESALKSLPNRSDETMMENLVSTLSGIVLSLSSRNVASIALNPRAAAWAEKIETEVAEIRRFAKALRQGGN